MSVILLDFETTDLDTSKARITEIGAQRTTDDFENVEASLSSLVWESGYPALSPEIIRVTGITQEQLTKEGIKPVQALRLLSSMVTKETRAIIAYNRAYDEPVFRTEVNRHTLTLDPGINWMGQVPWLCAMADVETNYQFRSWRLMHIALEYGVTVNPKILHRAIADVELMRQMLIASGSTIEKMTEFQSIPWVYVRANVSYEDKDLAKKAGFGWESAPGDQTGKRWDKMWVKRVKQSFYKKLEQDCLFPVKVIATA